MSLYKSLSLQQTADLIAAVGDVQTNTPAQHLSEVPGAGQGDLLRGDDRRKRLEGISVLPVLENLRLGGFVRVAHADAHHETVEL